ncbi:MAG: YfhO family protein [Lachnospiraceae bacterium]|nr:YfhO family protein [Lachnospiraceae bacterium]
MRHQKNFCQFTGIQMAIIGCLMILGVLFLGNGRPYKGEWEGEFQSIFVGFLQNGQYTLEVTYENLPKGSRLLVRTDDMTDENNRAGVVFLEQEIHEGSGVIRIPLSLESPSYGIVAEIMPDDAAHIAKLVVQSNHLIYKDHYVLFGIVILAAGVLTFLFHRMNREMGAWESQGTERMFLGYPEKYMTPLVLVGIGLLASLPLFSDGLLWGDDTAFHLVRLEGIYQGMRAGDFPVRITPQQVAGYGSLTAVMYPQLFLYPAVLLRFMGVSLLLSYKLLLAAVNLATAFSAYYAGEKIFHSRKIGIWISVLYTFSAYRLSNMYVRGALGESLAMVFLPLIIWGVYEILWGEGRWLVLVWGMTGVLESHVLSTEICILFMGAELFFWLCSKRKREFGKRFWNGCKAVAVTLLLNVSFLIPVLYYSRENFQCFHMPFELSGTGAYFSQLFTLFPPVDGASLGAGTTQHEMPITIGGVLLGGVILYLLLLGKKEDTKERGVGVHCFVYGGIALLMASWLFPWDRIAEREFLREMFTPLQFPWRFLGPVTVCWSFAAAVGIVGVGEGKLAWAGVEERKGGWILGVMGALVIVSTGYFFDHLAQDREQRADKMALEGLSDGDGMYLYRDSEEFRAIQLDYDRGKAIVRTNHGEGMAYQEYRKEGSRIYVEVTPIGEGAEVIMFPLYWYPGYEIRINGQKVPVFPRETLVACEAPEEEAVIEVRYEGFWFFKAADLVTLMTFCGMLGRSIYVKKKMA